MQNDRIFTLLARKLSGEASQTELTELELLQAQEPAMEETTKKMSDWWQVNTLVDNDFLEATYLLHLKRMKAEGYDFGDNDEIIEKQLSETEAAYSPKIVSYKRTAVGLLSLLVLILSAIFLTKTSRTVPLEKLTATTGQVETANGSRTKILLPDGSSVWLNSGSKLTYKKDFHSGPREVFLTGEAFFDVVKNVDRPFTIHTNKIDVKVTGTQFNVKAYSNDKTTETSLITGSVEVMLRNDSSTKYVLKPNDKLILQNDAAETKQKIQTTVPDKMPPTILVKQLTHIKGSNDDVETSWTRNILSFEDEQFVEVANKMERWYNVHFVFKNKKWQEWHLSGTFEDQSLQQAMDALVFSTGFNYKMEGDKVTIY